MRTSIIIIACVAFVSTNVIRGQERIAVQSSRDLRIQKIVHDLIGKTVTLNLKENGQRSGTLVSGNWSQLVLETDGARESYPASSVRSITISPGISEGLLAVLSSVLVGGFGLGVTTLSFEGATPGAQTVAAVVFSVLGGWLGYETFFQKTEIELP